MKSLALSATLLGSMAVAFTALADGGYYSGSPGATASGRAGAFVARADDVTAVSANPAGLAKLQTTLIQVGNRFSHNAYSYTRATTLDYGHVQNGVAPTVAFDRVENGTPWQALEPFLGAASNLGLRDWGFALAAFAPPGISRQSFPVGGGQRYMMVDREAIILNYAASVAWKHHDVWGVGATLDWVHVPRLTYSLIIDGSPFSGAANPVSSDLDMQATMTGSDPFTFNAILGAWFRPAPSLEFALAGQVVPANVVTHSKLSVVPQDRTRGDVVLTRNGAPADDVTVTLPLPLLARGGARYRHLVGAREVFDVELDVEYETWSRVKRFTVDTGGLQANFAGQVVNIDRIDIEKRWRDTVAVRLGGDYAVIANRWTLRGGAYYVTAVASPAYNNVDFSGGAQMGATAGTSVLFGHWEMAIAYALRAQPSTSVSEANARVYQQVPGSTCRSPYTDPATCNPNYLGQPGPVVNGGTYRATSHFVSLGLAYRFGN